MTHSPGWSTWEVVGDKHRRVRAMTSRWTPPTSSCTLPAWTLVPLGGVDMSCPGNEFAQVVTPFRWKLAVGCSGTFSRSPRCLPPPVCVDYWRASLLHIIKENNTKTKQMQSHAVRKDLAALLDICALDQAGYPWQKGS